MPWLSSIFGAGGGGGGPAQPTLQEQGLGAYGGPEATFGLGAPFLAWGLGELSAQRAYDRQKNWATRAPTYQATALERAGLNRALAATGGAASPASAPNVPKGQPGPTFDPRMFAVSRQLQNMEADTELKLSTADNVRTQAEGASLSNAEKRAMAAVWASPEGARYAQQIARNRAIPPTFQAWAIRTFVDMAQNYDGDYSMPDMMRAFMNQAAGMIEPPSAAGAAQIGDQVGPRRRPTADQLRSVDPQLERRQSIDPRR